MLLVFVEMGDHDLAMRVVADNKQLFEHGPVRGRKPVEETPVCHGTDLSPLAAAAARSPGSPALLAAAAARYSYGPAQTLLRRVVA